MKLVKHSKGSASPATPLPSKIDLKSETPTSGAEVSDQASEKRELTPPLAPHPAFPLPADVPELPSGFIPAPRPSGERRVVEGARYKGPDPDLKGKTALVRIYPDYVKAQFDDRLLPQAQGWHTFHLDDFEGLEAGDEPEGPGEPSESSPGTSSFAMTLAEEIAKSSGEVIERANRLVEETTAKPGLGSRSGGPGMFQSRRREGLASLSYQRPPEEDDPFGVQAYMRPSPEEVQYRLMVAMVGLDKQLRRIHPVLQELRDAIRVAAWSVIGAIACGVIYGIGRLALG